MKRNELMLGDWVAYRKDFPDRVNAIAIGGHAVSLEHDSWQQMSSIQPILLTPEILAKNGFVYGENYGECVLNDWQVLCDCAVIAARNERGWLIDIPCRYVHELQHALKLCGIEKEIVL